jgi:hypothetical protein
MNEGETELNTTEQIENMQHDAVNKAKRMVLTGSKYEDLGLNVEGLNMAAGAFVYGSWIDNVDWVRNIVFLAQSDQQYDVVVNRRDKAGASSWDYNIATAQSAVTGSNWRAHPANGVNALLGYSARIGIKNSSASSNTYGRVRVQLMGL